MRARTLAAAVAAVTLIAGPMLAQDFTAMWTAGPGDIWAASYSILFHGGSGSWIQITPAGGGDIANHNAIAGSGPRDVWIVGDRGQILHWNGTALQGMRSPVRGNLVSVVVCGPDDAWAASQSDDEGQAPTVIHWNGSAWSPTRLPFAFRVSGMVGPCVSGSGAGGGGGAGLTVVGASFFDPRPDQRRSVGVLMRQENGNWVASGWDGRRVTDPQLGNEGWAGVASNGGCLLLRGGAENATLLLGCRGGWQRLPAPTGEYLSAILLGNGTPVLIREKGWSILNGGAWRDVGGGPVEAMDTRGSQAVQRMMTPTGAVDSNRVAVLQRRMDSLSNAIGNSQPNGQQMALMMQLSQQMLQASGMSGNMANMQRNPDQMRQAMAQQQAQSDQNQRVVGQMQHAALFEFGRRAMAFAPPSGTTFYVGASNGIMRVAGDEPQKIFSVACASAALASQLAECVPEPGATRGPPLAAQRYPALPPEAVESAEQPQQQQQQQNRPGITVPRPRIRLPGRP